MLNSITSYILISIFMSVGYSAGDFDLATNRAPYMVVDCCCATIEDSTEDGMLYGFDQRGWFIAYGTRDEGFEVGQEYMSFIPMNPGNNAEDDFMARLDLRLK